MFSQSLQSLVASDIGGVRQIMTRLRRMNFNQHWCCSLIFMRTYQGIVNLKGVPSRDMPYSSKPPNRESSKLK